MQKRLSMKVVILIFVLAAAVVGSVFAILHFTKGTKAFRSIQIYELEGSADIKREGGDLVKAVENLYLQSGDRVTTAAGSFMRLKLDDDKYIMAEEKSVFSIEAEGSDEDSKTKIILEEGALTSEIQNKLSADSLYEVNTPNSVMAVRGTIFRTDLSRGDDGMLYTKLTVLEGTVSTRLYLPDGSLGEEVLTQAGHETIVRGEGAEIGYEEISRETVFEELPSQARQVIQKLKAEGNDIAGVPEDEKEDASKDKQENEAEVSDADAASDDAASQNSANDAQTSKKPAESESGKKTTSSDKKTNGKGTNTSESNVSSNEGNDQPSGSQADNAGTGQPGSSGGNQPGNNPSGGSTGGDNPNIDKQKTYTVTFMYKGTVFGTQTVQKNQKATVPKLKPEAAGSWDFNFSQAITKDTAIYWKSQP